MNLFRNQNKKFEETLKRQLEDLEYKPSESLWDKIASEIPDDGFENAFADSINSFQPKTNPENWNKIEPYLPYKNNTKKLYWIPLLFLFTGLAAYIGYQLKESAPQVAVGFEKQDERLNGSQEVNSRKLAVEIEKQDKRSLQRSELILKNKVDKNKKVIQPALPAQPENRIDKKKIGSRNTADRQNNMIQSKKVLTLPGQKETSPDLNHPGKTISSTNIDPAKDLSINDKPLQPVTPAAISSVTETKTGLAIVQEQKNSAPVSENNQENNLSGGNEKKSANDSIVQKSTVKNITNDDRLTSFSISIISGIHYCYNVLSAPSVSTINFNENISLRKKIESPSLDWSGAFLLDYAINENWRISSGVMVSNFTQEFQYSVLTPSGTHNMVSDPAANVSNQNDSIVNGNSYNNRIKYTWTEIPLLITYSFKHKNKMSIEIMTGVSYAIVTEVDAAYVSYDNVGVLVLNDKSGFPGVKNNFFFHFNPTVSYKLNEMVSLGLMPTFKYSITSITGNDNWVQQHPYFMGVSATLRKKF